MFMASVRVICMMKIWVMVRFMLGLSSVRLKVRGKASGRFKF
jgi:hypothetical protein